MLIQKTSDDGDDHERRRARPGGATSEPAPTPRSRANWRADCGPIRPAEDAEQVGQERRRRQRGQAERLEPTAPGDRRQQRRDERVRRHPTPMAATRSSDRLREIGRRPSIDSRVGSRTRAPRTGPCGLRGELTGSAMGSPSRWTRDAPREGGSPVLGKRFGRGDRSIADAPGPSDYHPTMTAGSPKPEIEVETLHVADFIHPAESDLAGRAGLVMAYAVRHPDGVVLFDSTSGTARTSPTSQASTAPGIRSCTVAPANSSEPSNPTASSSATTDSGLD